MRPYRVLLECVLLGSLVLCACEPSAAEGRVTRNSNVPDRALMPIEERPAIQLVGVVARGSDHRIGGSFSGGIEYHVSTTVTNTGSKEILFDAVEGAFVPPRGNALRVVTRPARKKDARGEADHPQRDQVVQAWSLAPGDRRSFEFATNGYTNSLLASADGKALQIMVTLMLDGAAVTPRFVASLPDLRDLPQRELIELGQERGRELSFSRVD